MIGFKAMSVNTDKAFQSLCTKLYDFPELESTPERHIFLLWLITRGATLMGGERPILVGGGAVEFYTGIRFATGDLDLIAPDVGLCESVLGSLGFERPANSRHFVNRSISALVDVHAATLRQYEETVELVYRKVPVLLISPEDCVADRLESYREHGSTLDLLNAFLMTYHQKDRIDIERMALLIGLRDLWDYYRPIQKISRELVCNQIGADEAAASLLQLMKKGIGECES